MNEGRECVVVLLLNAFWVLVFSHPPFPLLFYTFVQRSTRCARGTYLFGLEQTAHSVLEETHACNPCSQNTKRNHRLERHLVRKLKTIAE